VLVQGLFQRPSTLCEKSYIHVSLAHHNFSQFKLFLTTAILSSDEINTRFDVSYSCSTDGQDGGRQSYLEHADVVETTRTVREAAERAAATAVSRTSVTASGSALTGNGNTGPCMPRPDAHRAAAGQRQSNAENDQVQPPENETALEPEIGRLGNPSPEFVDDTFRTAAATVGRVSDKEELQRPRSEITSPRTQPEVVTLDRKSTCQEPRSERFDRVVQYFDSRQHVSGTSVINVCVYSC